MDHVDQATAIMEQAKQEVEKGLKSIDDEFLKAAQSAREEGSQKGYEKAKQLQEKLSKLKDLMLSEVDDEIVRAAVDVAEKMVQIELEKAPEKVVDVVQNALKSLPEIQEVRLRVHPLDAKALRSGKQKLVDVLERAKDIDIREDKQVERGGVLIQTEAGVIDAQVKTQLEEIARILGV